MFKAAPDSSLRDFAVVDVRSDDFVVSPDCPLTRKQEQPGHRSLSRVGQGGNIVNCVNSPAETFHVDVDGLVQKLQGGTC